MTMRTRKVSIVADGKDGRTQMLSKAADVTYGHKTSGMVGNRLMRRGLMLTGVRRTLRD